MLSRELAFYASVAYGFLRRCLAGHEWYTRITPNVIVGALPLRSSWDRVEHTERITHILSLLEPFEVKSFVIGPSDAEKRGLHYLSLPVRDFVASPTTEQIHAGIAFIRSCEIERGNVYVHCKAGRTRSAFVVACYLIQHDRIDVNTALEQIRTKRPHVRFSRSQLTALHQFAQSVIDKRGVS